LQRILNRLIDLVGSLVYPAHLVVAALCLTKASHDANFVDNQSVSLASAAIDAQYVTHTSLHLEIRQTSTGLADRPRTYYHLDQGQTHYNCAGDSTAVVMS
jgi:hypothetical protein